MQEITNVRSPGNPNALTLLNGHRRTMLRRRLVVPLWILMSSLGACKQAEIRVDSQTQEWATGDKAWLAHKGATFKTEDLRGGMFLVIAGSANRPVPGEIHYRGMGTAFAISPSGLLMSCYHVLSHCLADRSDNAFNNPFTNISSALTTGKYAQVPAADRPNLALATATLGQTRQCPYTFAVRADDINEGMSKQFANINAKAEAFSRSPDAKNFFSSQRFFAKAYSDLISLFGKVAVPLTVLSNFSEPYADDKHSKNHIFNTFDAVVLDIQKPTPSYFDLYPPAPDDTRTDEELFKTRMYLAGFMTSRQIPDVLLKQASQSQGGGEVKNFEAGRISVTTGYLSLRNKYGNLISILRELPGPKSFSSENPVIDANRGGSGGPLFKNPETPGTPPQNEIRKFPLAGIVQSMADKGEPGAIISAFSSVERIRSHYFDFSIDSSGCRMDVRACLRTKAPDITSAVGLVEFFTDYVP